MNIGDQSFIPSYTSINPPQAIIDPLSPSLNVINDSPMASHFGSTCVPSAVSYECSNNSDNPLFGCSANNNNYYGWDASSLRNHILITAHFTNQFQSMNVLITFLMSTSSNISVPMYISYTVFLTETIVLSLVRDDLPTNLSEGPFQHTFTLLPDHDVMFNGVAITITPDPTLQWVAIGKIIFCPAVTDSEGLWS